MTVVLGLTGGIATGKTTASNFFKARGIPVIDSDIIAREVVEVGTPGLALVVAEFGAEILLEDGSLNRKKLGSIIFSDGKRRKKLDEILANELNEAISLAIRKWLAEDVSLVVVDVPLLFEASYDQTVDETMVIYVPEEIQLQRLMARDGLSEQEARQRILSQWPIEEKRKLADVVIDNSGTQEETEKKLARWLKKLY